MLYGLGEHILVNAKRILEEKLKEHHHMKEYIITLREPVYNGKTVRIHTLKCLMYEVVDKHVIIRNVDGEVGIIPLANIAGIVEKGAATA